MVEHLNSREVKVIRKEVTSLRKRKRRCPITWMKKLEPNCKSCNSDFVPCSGIYKRERTAENKSPKLKKGT